MKEKRVNKQKIVVHIKRLQGQLSAVAKELEQEKTDCISSSETLFAAARSFSSLKQHFVQCFLEQEFFESKKSKSEEKKLLALLNLIKG